MATEREIALELALVAVIGAAHTKEIDVTGLLDHAQGLLTSKSRGHSGHQPYVYCAAQEINDAHARVLGGDA